MGEMAKALQEHLSKNGIRRIKNNSFKESDEQIHFITWLKIAHPEVISIVCPIVSYGTNFQRMKHWSLMKKLGFTKGTPDIFIAVSRSIYHGLFIEMKIKGNSTSKEQNDVMNRLKSENYFVEVAYSCDEAVKVFERYMAL